MRNRLCKNCMDYTIKECKTCSIGQDKIFYALASSMLKEVPAKLKRRTANIELQHSIKW